MLGFVLSVAFLPSQQLKISSGIRDLFVPEKVARAQPSMDVGSGPAYRNELWNMGRVCRPGK